MAEEVNSVDAEPDLNRELDGMESALTEIGLVREALDALIRNAKEREVKVGIRSTII